MRDQIERPANVLPFRAENSSQKVLAGFEIRGAENDTLEVWLYGEVGWEIQAQRVINELKEIDAEGKTITFPINSPGGDVFEGYAIGNYIKSMKAKTVARVDALAASMASFIAISCDEVVMHENSMMMIHEPWSITMGNRADHEATAVLLGKLTDQMVAAYEEKRERTLGVVEGAEDIRGLVKAETWLTASEAQALGFANEIVGSVDIAACVRADVAERFQNAPESIDALVVAESDAEDEVEDQIEEVPAEPEVTEPEALSEEAQTEIATACKLFGKEDLAAGFISAMASLDDVRTALFEARAEEEKESDIDNRIPTAGAPDDTANAARHRAGVSAIQALNAQTIK
tara:strand:- start:1071 stop:2108 length:1038 start_codon:yes stop_codon:yes gene_type:complete